MKYPVLIERNTDDNTYNVTVPDLPGCQSKVNDIDEGFGVSIEMIKGHLSILAEYGEKVPNASSIEKQRTLWREQNKHLANAEQRLIDSVWGLVDVDITPYLGRSHKINVTLPELLISQIDDRVSKSEQHKTRSGFIAAACIAELAKD